MAAIFTFFAKEEKVYSGTYKMEKEKELRREDRMKLGEKRVVKVVVVGAGEVAKSSHLPVYSKIRESKVIAICDVNKEAAAKTSRLWNIPLCYSSLEACLDEEVPDLVDICTPPNSHLPLTLQALKAGSHVISEKPFVMNLKECEEAERLYHQFKCKGLSIGVIHNWLFEFLTPTISSIVNSGKIGEIQRVDVDIYARPDDSMIRDPNHWCHSIIGGRLGECLIHPIYILQRILGPLDVSQVFVSKRGSHLHVAFDELFAVLKSRDGKLCTTYITFNSPRRDFPVISIYGSDKHLFFFNSNLVVLGTLGYHKRARTLLKGFDNLRQITHILKSLCHHTAKRIFRTKRTGHEVLIADFIKHIITGSEPLYCFEEALNATKTYLEILQRFSDKNVKDSTFVTEVE